MTIKQPQRLGCFWLAIAVMASFGNLALAQDTIPLVPKSSKHELIRELHGVDTPVRPKHRTDLINDLPRGPVVEPAAPQNRKNTPSAVVTEILKLRAADPHAKRDPVEEAEFAEALQQLVDQKKREHAEVKAQQSAEWIPLKQGSPSGNPLQAHLRESARHMESVAMNYEFAGDYEAADKARAAAQQLWHEARKVGE